MTRRPARSVRLLAGASWPLLVATIAAAVAGACAAYGLVPGDTTAPVVPRAGGATLPLRDGWEPVRRSAIPGLQSAPSARGQGMHVAIDVRLPDDSSLLPAQMLHALHAAAPRPEPTRSGGRVAWSYDLPGRGRTRITALALPTDRGVVTLACMGPRELVELVANDCGDALATVELAGAAPLRPAPETAVRLVAGPVIARLDEARSAGRRTLARTRSPTGRAAAARRIAAAYSAAARRLDPLAHEATPALPRALGALAREHRSLAAASARRDALSARRSGAAIARDEQQLAGLLAAVTADP
jgi:hypothetical protein